MVSRKDKFTLGGNKYSIAFAVVLIAAAAWARAYPLILPIVLVSWAYIRTDTFTRLADWVEDHTPFGRTILSWGLATLFSAAIVAYVLYFIVVLATYTTPDVDGGDDDGSRLCLVAKIKYGVVRNADHPDDYYRTHRIGTIMRGDHAIVSTPDGELIQRIVAKPGDTVSIVDAALIVNSSADRDVSNAVATFCLRPRVPYADLRKIREANASLGPKAVARSKPLMVRFRDGHTDHQDTTATRLPIAQRRDNWLHDTFAPMPPGMPDQRCYPSNAAYHWNAYQWGPLRLPCKGDKIPLTFANVMLYGPMVKMHEGVNLKPTPGVSYTFRLSYFMTLNDDRDILADGRIYGPVPESKIIANVITL